MQGQPGNWAPPPQAVLGSTPAAWAPPPPQQAYAPFPAHEEGVHRRNHAAGVDAGLEGGLPFSPETIAKIGQIGLSTYGEKMLGAGHSFVEQNYAKYLSGNELRYYFTVNSRYVVNKLKLLLFPFALKGHWARSHEQVAGGAKFKPPAHDINAPDLYIPLLAFCTYCLVCCMVDIASASSKFKPERLGRFAWWGVAAWAGETLLLWAGLRSLTSSHAPLHVPMLDLASYSGYTFVSVSVQCVVGLFSRRGYYFMLLWGSLATAIFLVKTLKRILFSEARHYGTHSSRDNYLLLALALSQLPFIAWLGVRPSY